MSYLIYNHQRDMDEQYNSQHTHDDKIEIVQILSGSGRILVGNNFCVFRPGDVFIIDAGVIHCTSPDVPAEYTRNKLLFVGRTDRREAVFADLILFPLRPQTAFRPL